MIELREFDLADPSADTTIPTAPTWILVRFGRHVLGELRFDGSQTDDESVDELAHRHLSRAIAARRVRRHSDVVVDERRCSAVTIVICTRNRSTELAGCLDAIACVDPPPGQVLVVDNDPDDDASHVVAREAGADYVLEPSRGLNHARNTGWRTASGDIVVYVDDDARADRHLVDAVIRSFFDETVGAVTGLVLAHELETPAQIAFERKGGMRKGFTTHIFTPGSIGLQAFRLGVGTNMAFRCAALEAVGGFDPAIGVGTPSRGGGDLEGLWRVLEAGYDVVYQPDAIVRHRHRRTWPELIQQHKDFGTSYGSFLHRLAAERRGAALKETLRWHLRRHVLGPLGAIRHRDRTMLRLLLAEAVGSRSARRLPKSGRRR